MVDIKWIGSPQFKVQNGIAKLFITDHWMVGTLASTDQAFNSGRAASATYGVGETEIHQYVNEKDYPFSDGNTYANQHTISIEHEGGWLQADGTRKNPSPAVLELSAQLHADIARRHGFGKLVIGSNVFPHSHWVATMCPGTLNMDWIVARANEINAGSTTAGNGSTPITSIPTEEEDVKLRFITANTTSPWYATNGMTKRMLAPGEDQLLVDLGLAIRELDGGGVKQIGQVAIDRIANA